MNALQIQMEDALASIWYAIQSAELTDIPTIAAYLITQTRTEDANEQPSPISEQKG